MADELANDQDGLLPEPDAAETLHLLMRGSASDQSWWRRLLPPSLCSVGFHLFFMSFVAVITVTFADEILTYAAWDAETYAIENSIDNSSDYDLTVMERDLPVKDVDEVPLPTQEKEPDKRDLPSEKAGQGPPQPVLPVAPNEPKLFMKPARVIDDDGSTRIVQSDDSIPAEDKQPDVIFVPTPKPVVDRMLTLAKVKPGDVVFDLGCGDGRIVVTAAKKFGALGVGYDIDPERIKESLENVKKQSLQGKVLIERRDIFKVDLSKADVVALYLIPTLNGKLIPQLEKMKPGSRIVSHDFAFWHDDADPKPDYVEDFDDGDDNGNKRTHKIFLWTTPLKKTSALVLEQLPPPKPAGQVKTGKTSPQLLQILKRISEITSGRAAVQDVRGQLDEDKKECVIHCTVKPVWSKVEVQEISQKILQLPELAPYKVDLNIQEVLE
jgi:hypothetical protein